MSADQPVDIKPRSRDVTDGKPKAAARAMLRAIGLTEDDWVKPQVGIANSWNEITPCNMTLRALAEDVQGGHPRGRRGGPRVRHDHRVRRHLDGPRGDARLARQPRGQLRLGRDGRVRRAPRRLRRDGRLRQVDAGDADGVGPPRPGQHPRLQRLDHAGRVPRPGARHHERVRGRRRQRGRHDERRRPARDRAAGVPRRGRVRRHVHRQHDELDRRGDRDEPARARRHRRRSTPAATPTPRRPGRPSCGCSSSASRRARS